MNEANRPVIVVRTGCIYASGVIIETGKDNIIRIVNITPAWTIEYSIEASPCITYSARNHLVKGAVG